jgi:murein hydrolase activator
MKTALLRKHFFLIIIALGPALYACAQPAPNKTDLEKERASIQKEIDEVRQSLDETKKNKKETLGQLALLQKRLRLRQAAVQNINEQINFIQSDMNNSWSEILKLRRELDTLRKQYSESVVYAYENRSNYDFLNFIFAATSFNDAIKRIAYLKSYRRYREERAENIQKTQQQLQDKIDGLKTKREEKDDVLAKANKEKQVLEVEKKEKDVVVNKLQSQEKELKKEMALKQRQDQKLSNAIAAAIRRARDEAIRDAKKKAAADAAANLPAERPEPVKTTDPSSNSNNNAATKPAVARPDKAVTLFKTTADVELSDNFEKAKGHLPWPVESGNIAIAFGRHEYLKGIFHDNTGITIETPSGTTVKAVFSGEVQSVFNVGDISAVMIRHGKYFTTYSNLSSVSVAKGQQVKTGQMLGRVADIGQLEFVVSDEKDHNFDPERWLRR